MLNVEGLGRSLDPELDLWKTAKPYLERWMNEQIGLRGWYERLKIEAPQWSKTLPQLPRLIHHALALGDGVQRSGSEPLLQKVLIEQQRTNRLLQSLLVFGLAVAAGVVVAHFLMYGA
jgi:ubiquinone biosynthesis protein